MFHMIANRALLYLLILLFKKIPSPKLINSIALNLLASVPVWHQGACVVKGKCGGKLGRQRNF